MTTPQMAPENASLALLREQRSHVLFVLSNGRAGHDAAFLKWYRGAYRNQLTNFPGVLTVGLYERHELDLTLGRYPPPPFRYLGLCDLSLDGAQAAEGMVEHVTALHRDQPAAEAPATWLYYPVSEKVGRSPPDLPAMLTLAFANAVAGRELEFREWYATRHIRHALNIPALVSGQCFERTQFQRSGALEPSFNTIAVYEQADTPQAILDSLNSIPKGVLDFPAMDPAPLRFAEAAYTPL